MIIYIYIATTVQILLQVIGTELLIDSKVQIIYEFECLTEVRVLVIFTALPGDQ